MFKKLCLAAGLVASMLFAGCASAPVPLTVPTPAQLTADFCPVVNADLKVLAASPLLNASQQQLLNGVPGDASQPGIIAINAAVCAAGATLNVSDIKALNATAFPALIGLVSALPMIPNQPAILIGLTLAQPILTQIINSLPVPAAPASAVPAASVPVAASAPVAASQ
jgi:hypothetical protein